MACRHLLLDIEGTITPISFVKEKLFPFARSRIKAFLQEQLLRPQNHDSVFDYLHAIRSERRADGGKTVVSDSWLHDRVVDGVDVDHVLDRVDRFTKKLIDSDEKWGPLKQLQGRIWKQGYENGHLKGIVYDDVVPALKSLSFSHVHIYSSGSVQAQKLLLKYSNQGDLTALIHSNFDTVNAGPKQETQSYRTILQALDCDLPSTVLFITDSVAEARAARDAGISVILSARADNPDSPTIVQTADSEQFPVISTFSEIEQLLQQQPASKKRKPSPVQHNNELKNKKR